LLADEPAAESVAGLLRDGGVVMVAANLAEALDLLGRHSTPAISDEELHRHVDPLLSGPITVVSVTGRHAWIAARIRRAHYRRADQAVSLADCFALAACGPGDRLATADPALLTISAIEGVETIRLLDARGG
jgi:uncharacterized protein with PIN domain